MEPCKGVKGEGSWRTYASVSLFREAEGVWECESREMKCFSCTLLQFHGAAKPSAREMGKGKGQDATKGSEMSNDRK